MKDPSSRRTIQIVTAWGLLFAGTVPVWAHNTWLIPSQYSAKQPTAIRLALITTEHFPVSEHKTSPQRVAQWVARLGQDTTAIRDYHVEKLELAAEVRLNQPGVHVIAAVLHPRFIEFEPDYFEQYLADEHAIEALALRQKAGDGDKPGRMEYTKLVKTFVEISNHPTADYQAPVGHTLEIIPLSNPCRWRVGDQVRVRVLYEGKPAAQLRVSSGHEHMSVHQHRRSQSHDYVENVFTDTAGEAGFTLTCPGQWFLRTHFIRPLKGEKKIAGDSPQTDWESFWASVTFRVDEHGPIKDLPRQRSGQTSCIPAGRTSRPSSLPWLP
jgi:uncharacterized GH25 family protein